MGRLSRAFTKNYGSEQEEFHFLSRVAPRGACISLSIFLSRFRRSTRVVPERGWKRACACC